MTRKRQNTTQSKGGRSVQHYTSVTMSPTPLLPSAQAHSHHPALGTEPAAPAGLPHSAGNSLVAAARHGPTDLTRSCTRGRAPVPTPRAASTSSSQGPVATPAARPGTHPWALDSLRLRSPRSSCYIRVGPQPGLGTAALGHRPPYPRNLPVLDLSTASTSLFRSTDTDSEENIGSVLESRAPGRFP